jgi:hypothetical protein
VLEVFDQVLDHKDQDDGRQKRYSNSSHASKMSFLLESKFFKLSLARLDAQDKNI